MIHQIKQPNPQQQSFSPSTDVEAKLQQAIPLHQADQFQQTKQRCQQIQRDCPPRCRGNSSAKCYCLSGWRESDCNWFDHSGYRIQPIHVFNSLGGALQEQGG